MKSRDAAMTDSDKNSKFPLGMVLIAAVVTVGVAVWDGFSDHKQNDVLSVGVDRAARTSEVAGRILHLDEVLTMSARMAAVTGDKAWIDRYRQFESELDGLITEAVSMSPTTEGPYGASETAEANEALLRMEKLSFGLACQGKTDEAFALLTGPEYQRQKRVYSAGMATFVKTMMALQRREATSQNEHVLDSKIAQIATVCLILGLWILALRRASLAWRGKARQYRALAESLQQSEQRHRALFEASHDAMMTLAPPAWRFTSGNPAVLGMFGTKDEVCFTEMGPWDLSPETQPDGSSSAETAAEAIGKAMKEGSHFFEWTHKRVNGETFPSTVLLTRVELGGQVQLQATVRDITVQKQAEDAVKREAAKLSAMISGMNEGVVFADADNVIVEINEFLCRFMGKRREQIIGKRIENIHRGDVLQGLVAKIARFRENPNSGPYVIQRPVGSAEVILRMQPIYSCGRYDGVLLNVIDVTELVLARRKAEDANTAKSRFLANMSHEIRTPMTAILGFTDIIDQSIECCPTCPEYQQCPTRSSNRQNIDVIRRNGKHLLTLINDILDLSKIEAGKMVAERVTCSPSQLLEEVASLSRVQAVEKGLALDLHYDWPIPDKIVSDSVRCRQILVNLASNAVKFTSEGSVSITLRSRAGSNPGRAIIEFAVNDTGVGLTSGQILRLFQPFAQADSSTTRKYGGTGLGLAISKKLAQALNGDITVESRPGEGSVFTLALDVALAPNARMIQSTDDLTGEARGDTKSVLSQSVQLDGRILLAEDGKDNQLLISTILKVAGVQVELARNGREAMDKALAAMSAGRYYDAILMDIQMPEMDGYEATRQLRLNGYDAPIIALTAHAMADDRGKCIEAGCDDYATKPVNRQKLLNTIAGFMAAGEVDSEPEATESDLLSRAGNEPIRSQFADDPDMTELIDTFVAGLPMKIAAMSEALKNNCFDQLHRLAHQLKGSGGGYGYPLLTDLAQRLQQAGDAQDPEAAGLALAGLEKATRSVTGGRKTSIVAKGE